MKIIGTKLFRLNFLLSSYNGVVTLVGLIHLSVVAGLVMRHGDLSHEMILSHEGRRPECDNVNRNTMSHNLPATTDLLPLKLILKKLTKKGKIH